ncbi:MAG: DUF1284 domain-containing protein, partial [Lachnospiraceae bacterium]|nr:DUF1284 domain-containing protein [Lachnospiraceae bacterium]
MMRLRVHHLLCSALYVGKGYSAAFCGNMQKVVTWLWEPLSGPDEEKEQREPGDILCEGENREIRLITAPDDICRECPNLGDNGCKLDDDHVVTKDAVLAQELGLEVGHIYPVTELLHTVSSNLTAEIFENSCHNCDWYGQGRCH